MKLFHIALFLFNIVAISADTQTPENLEINWIKAWKKNDGSAITDKDHGAPLYEMRYNYKDTSDTVESTYFTVFDQQVVEQGAEKQPKPKSKLQLEMEELKQTAESIATDANEREGLTIQDVFNSAYQPLYTALEPKFTVAFVDLTAKQVAALVNVKTVNPDRISGEVKIRPDYKKFEAKLAIEGLVRFTNNRYECAKAIFPFFEKGFEVSGIWQIGEPRLSKVGNALHDCSSGENRDEIVKQIVDYMASTKNKEEKYITVEKLLKSTMNISIEKHQEHIRTSSLVTDSLAAVRSAESENALAGTAQLARGAIDAEPA